MSQVSCIFCRIVGGDAPCARVFEDERTLAFMDIQPLSRGHLLVIPKQHAENLFEISAEDLAAVALTSRRLAPVLKSVVQPEGLRVIQLNGAAAGQTVFHYHMHLLPKFANEEDRFLKRVAASEDELQQVADAITAALASS